MNKPNNVIDLKSRARKSTTTTETTGPAAPILDMTERRNEMLSHERRKVRRTLLSEFVGAHVIVPERGLQSVAMYDISEDGIAFDMDLGGGKFSPGDEVGFRVYLNHKTYFPFVVLVVNSREIPEEGVVRHGGKFMMGTINDVALHHFVKFVETVSASLRTDQGDVMVSGIRK
jgi:PilZ domain